MHNLLNEIYYDYYNLNKKSHLPLDKDYMRLVIMIKNEDIENTTMKEMIKKYKMRNNYADKVLKGNLSDDDYWIEKETIHITYPFEETLERIEVLYDIVGKEKWLKIFNFEYEDLYNFITFLIFRIYNYNNSHFCKNLESLKEYEEIFPNSKECYFTKKEMYIFFKDKQTIDNLFEFLSIDIKKLDSIIDSTRIIHYREKYYLFFIWDFLYYLFDRIENKILQNVNNLDNYYKEKGKKFENLCYKKLTKYFKKEYVYKNLEFNYKKGNHEIDLILELSTSYIIFECKSAKFDINKITTNKELYQRFVKAFGRGYKTINDIKEYVNSRNNEFFEKTTQKRISLDFKNKKVYYINLSLSNIEYMQTQIQKIKTEYIKPVDIYPICWNYMDFGSIMKLASLNIKLFNHYLNKRTNLLNKMKNITFDIDEIDVFGFLTDSQNDNVFEMMIKHSNMNIDENFMVSNGIYREELNQIFNTDFIRNYIKGIVH